MGRNQYCTYRTVTLPPFLPFLLLCDEYFTIRCWLTDWYGLLSYKKISDYLYTQYTTNNYTPSTCTRWLLLKQVIQIYIIMYMYSSIILNIIITKTHVQCTYMYVHMYMYINFSKIKTVHVVYMYSTCTAHAQHMYNTCNHPHYYYYYLWHVFYRFSQYTSSVTHQWPLMIEPNLQYPPQSHYNKSINHTYLLVQFLQ